MEFEPKSRDIDRKFLIHATGPESFAASSSIALSELWRFDTVLDKTFPGIVTDADPLFIVEPVPPGGQIFRAFLG